MPRSLPCYLLSSSSSSSSSYSSSSSLLTPQVYWDRQWGGLWKKAAPRVNLCQSLSRLVRESWGRRHAGDGGPGGPRRGLQEVKRSEESGRGARSIVVLLYGVKWTGNFLLKKAFGLSEWVGNFLLKKAIGLLGLIDCVCALRARMGVRHARVCRAWVCVCMRLSATF